MFTSDAARRIEARDDNRRAIDEAKALGAPCLVLVVGGLPQFSRPGSAASNDITGARAQVRDAIADMMDYARDANMPLAIEPLHPAYAADRTRRKGSPAGVSRLRLAGPHKRHPERPRHDGRRRDRTQIDTQRRRGAGLCRLLRNRDFFERLVGKADG